MATDTRKTVLITAPLGFRVFATSRSLKTMESLEKDGIETIKLDITDDDDISPVANEISKRTGGTLDILVNNASVGMLPKFPIRPSRTQTWKKVRQLFDISVIGHYAVTRAFIPLLIKADRGPSISYMPYNGAYGSSKAAIDAIADTLRVEQRVKVVSLRRQARVLTVTRLKLVTGTVMSNLAPRLNFDGVFPGGSMYKPIEHSFRDVFARGTKGSTPTHVYAKAAVDEALKKSPAHWFWTGALSYSIWLLSDGIVSKQYGLNKLGEIVRAQKRA
ncbi:NAD(P)-binding protein [Schizophyllum commune H4-8]|uniref:NAD(P)-binding protein n=1 Tax=Schizophyllum commune (strain H4-8 / FGSC 9210) TaxID=578458 RepID=D8PT98_SCHCM|nr:NAD(P)-binding protein [Schizophyllum commune H4-8]KAI5899377.1 NAD(P)-binding protein [Schizophyllum commune H4-8]